MTDFEISALHHEIESLLQWHFMNFVTIYFAVVVAGYFVAEKLPWTILIAVLLMFTGFTVLNLSVVEGLLEQSDVYVHLHAAACHGARRTAFLR